MSLLFCDSFDHYTYAQMARKWSAITGGANGEINAAAGRNGSNGFQPTTSGSSTTTTLNLTANYATLIVGFALKFPFPSAQALFFAFGDTGTAQLVVYYQVNGSISVYRGDGTHMVSTAAGSLPTPSAVHNYVEIKVTIHNSAGAVEVRINGVSAASATGLDTQQTANAYANQVWFTSGAPNASWHVYVDDFYLCDTAGSVNNNFLGDVRVECIRPNAEGSEIDLAPSTGTDNSANVDETTPNDETDYNSSSSPGDRDKYVLGNLASTVGSVLAVAVNTMDRKDDSGARTHKHIIDLSATESLSAAFSPTTAYSNHQSIFEAKPGGGAFTITDVNNLAAGLELTT